MATIKSFTSLEQSRKLAEILPFESADMYYNLGESQLPDVIYGDYDDFKCYLPCWSLASLLKLLPKSTQLKKGNATELYRVTLPVELESSDWYVDPVDACVSMIEKLNELNLL